MKTPKEFLSEKYPEYERDRGMTGHDDIHMEKMMEEYGQQIRNESKLLYIAASQVLHLHLCEQEGIVSGQPTPKQWLEAVDKLSKALHP